MTLHTQWYWSPLAYTLDILWHAIVKWFNWTCLCRSSTTICPTTASCTSTVSAVRAVSAARVSPSTLSRTTTSESFATLNSTTQHKLTRCPWTVRPHNTIAEWSSVRLILIDYTVGIWHPYFLKNIFQMVRFSNGRACSLEIRTVLSRFQMFFDTMADFQMVGLLDFRFSDPISDPH